MNIFERLLCEYYIRQWIYVVCVKLDVNCLSSDILELGQPRGSLPGVIVPVFLLSKSSGFTFDRGYHLILATKELAQQNISTQQLGRHLKCV